MSREPVAGMEPLLQEARQKGLWLYCSYHQLWFAPDELEAAQADGRFRWGPVNWQLRDPTAHLERLRKDAEAATQGGGDGYGDESQFDSGGRNRL